MGLSCEVHDCVNLVFLEDIRDEVTTADISLYEFEVGEVHYLFEVLETGAVVELIIYYNIVVWVLLGKEDGCMGSDES